jgi:hypothetical protein
MNRRERRAAAKTALTGEDKLLPMILGSDMRAMLGDGEAERLAKLAFRAVLNDMGGKIPAKEQYVGDVKLHAADGSVLQLTVTIDVLNAGCVQIGFPSDFAAAMTPEQYKEHYRDMPRPPANPRIITSET